MDLASASLAPLLADIYSRQVPEFLQQEAFIHWHDPVCVLCVLQISSGKCNSADSPVVADLLEISKIYGDHATC